MPALSRRQSPTKGTPLEALRETEQRLLTELRQQKAAADVRQSSLSNTAKELEERASALSSTVDTLPQSLGDSGEQTIKALGPALHAIRADLQTYGLAAGGALVFAIILLVIAFLGR